MTATTKTEPILIIWLLAAVIAILLLVSAAHTTKVDVPTMHWQSDSSWLKSW